MNLMKLFNSKYANQNTKKSKGILAIMFIVIPIITMAILYNYDNTAYKSPFYIPVLMTANFIGMFLIPFVLSNVLLGYVYSKKQIDFVNSMPISRKKIFLTNIFVGIFYIIALQLFNFIVLGAYVAIIKTSVISIEMLYDSFLIMTIGYIYVYIVSALALTISGNVFTQFVLTSLILFLIPFIRITNFEFYKEGIEFINANGSSYLYSRYERFDAETFVMPIHMLVSFAMGITMYNVKSMIVTVICSIIYTFIGTKLFENRKMEDAGYSFQSNKIHLLVKSITLLPMITILYEIYNQILVLEVVLIVFLIFVYYCVYDLITKKKIKLKTTIFSFIISCLILLGIVAGMHYLRENVISKTKKIDYNDVENISVSTFMSEITDEKILEKLVIKDKETENLILDNLISNSWYFLDDGAYIRRDSSNERNIILMFTMKNGKKEVLNVTMKTDAYIKLLEKLKSDDEYLENLASLYKLEDKDFIDFRDINQKICVKEEPELKEAINKYIKENLIEHFKNEIESYRENTTTHCYIYKYNNHDRRVYVLYIYDKSKLNEEIIKVFNRKSKEAIERIEKNEEQIVYNNHLDIIRKIENSRFTERKTGIGNDKEKEDIFKFIKDNYTKKFDSTKSYYKITNHSNILFYTNEIEKIEKILMDNKDFDGFEFDEEIYFDDVVVENAEVVIQENV